MIIFVLLLLLFFAKSFVWRAKNLRHLYILLIIYNINLIIYFLLIIYNYIQYKTKQKYKPYGIFIKYYITLYHLYTSFCRLEGQKLFFCEKY